MAKNKINKDEIEALYEYAVKYSNKEMSLKQIYIEFTQKFAHKQIKSSTINFYLYVYGHLINGVKYTGIISDSATRYYLDKILETKGKDILVKALTALSLHIKYHDMAGRSRRGQRIIEQEYIQRVLK
ncbi:TPA: hypothetical protein ACG0AG_001763 [Elizabethkingia anophelis]